MRADARAEWQRSFSASGFAFDASYGGLEQWAPLQGVGLADRGDLIGAGLSAEVGHRATFRFNLIRRASPVGDNAMVSLQVMVRF